ncbi:MAG: PEP-CTERM sorting domain-containing protein [Pirellula sp.]
MLVYYTMGMYAMRKMLLLCFTVVLGLTSVNSASAGFIAGANTNVKLLKSEYKTATGLVNLTTGTPGNGTLLTSPAFQTSPGSAYSQLLSAAAASGLNVYLVSPTAANFSVSFTDGEKVVGVAASNAIAGMLTNVWGSHIGLQGDVLTALQGWYGNTAAVTTTASSAGVFGAGSQAIEIIGATPDTYNLSAFAVNGTVNSTPFNGVNGLNELSLVFTVVPEPTSLGLFGIGTLVVGLVRLRRKKS